MRLPCGARQLEVAGDDCALYSRDGRRTRRRVAATLGQLRGGKNPREQAMTTQTEQGERIARLEADSTNTASRLDRIEGKIDSNFKWTIGIMVVLHGITIAMIGTALFS